MSDHLLVIERIVAADWLDRARDLAMDHWREVAEPLGLPAPNIDPEHVALLEQAGALFAIGAMVGQRLVGYSLNVLGPTLNFSNLRVCQNEGLFVDRQHRGRTSLKLIHATEAEAVRLSCKRMMWHTYARTRADALFSRIGYADHDHIWSKEIACQADLALHQS
jgi:GNAT superfamily N-acetyltransferase